MATGVAAADNTPAFPDLALATILSRAFAHPFGGLITAGLTAEYGLGFLFHNGKLPVFMILLTIK
jgi:hypothetical protein